MKKGFTLIELLVVIAILAVLATAVILVINPAQLIRQARDSTRISDLAAVNSAISLYLADVASPGLGGGDGASCGVVTEVAAASTTCGNRGGAVCSLDIDTAIDGTGWVRVDFEQISSGAPLSKLPTDPLFSTTAAPSTNCGTGDEACYYSFICNGLNYEINATMESTKFANTGSGDVESKDGGSDANLYEVGNSLSL